MPATKSTKVVVEMELDTSNAKKQLNDLEQIGLEVNLGNKDIAEIKKLRDEIDKLDASYEKLSTSKLNTKTFNDASKQIQKSIDEVKASLSQMQHGITQAFASLAEVDKGKIQGIFGNAVTAVEDLTTAATNMKTAVSSAAQSFNTVEIVSSKDTKNLQKTLDLSRDIVNAFNQVSENAEKAYSRRPDEKAIKYASRLGTALEALSGDYYDLSIAVEDFEGDKGSSEFSKLQKELVSKIAEIKVATQKLREVSEDRTVSGTGFTYDKVKSRIVVFESIESELNQILGRAQAKVNEINRTLGELGNIGEDGKTTSKGIAVPMYVSTKPGTFKKMVEQVLQVTQDAVAKEPIEVRIALISDYKSKKNQEILEQMATQIGDIPDTEIREKFANLLINMQKQFEQEINLHIGTDIDDTERKVQNGIKRLQRALNKIGIYIHPEFSLKDADVNKIQRQLNKISKQLTLNLDKIIISDKAITEATGNGSKKGKRKLVDAQAIKDTAAIAALLSDIISKEEEVFDSNKEIVESLETIKAIISTFPIDEIIGPAKQLVEVFSKLTTPFTANDLDSRFESIKESVSVITGQLRGANLDKIREVLADFRAYQAAGGTKTIEELGGAENVQRWLKKYNKKVGNELPVVSGSLDSINSGIDEISQSLNNIDYGFDSLTNWENQFVGAISHIKQEITSLFRDGNYSLSDMFGDWAASDLVNGNKDIKKNVQQTKDEADALKDVSSSSKNASESKEEFAIANREVLESILSSLSGLSDEASLFKALNALINSFGGKGSDEKIAKVVENLQKLRKALSEPLGADGLVSALERVAASGVDLESLAKVLKANKKALEEAANTISGGEDRNILNGNEKEIDFFAKEKFKELSGEDAKIINSSMQKTKEGWVEIAGLIENANGELKEYTILTKNGADFTTEGVSEGTTRIAKQMKTYAQLESWYKQHEGNGGEFKPFDFDPQVWQTIEDYLHTFKADLGDIQKISRETRVSPFDNTPYESFNIQGSKGNFVIGKNGEPLIENTNIVDAKGVKKQILDIEKDLKELERLRDKVAAGTANAGDIEAINRIEAAWKDVKIAVDDTNTALGSNNIAQEQLEKTVNNIERTYNDAQTKYIDKMYTALNDAATNKYNKNKTFTPEELQRLKDAVVIAEQYREAIEMHASTHAPWSDDQRAQLMAWQTQLEEAKNSIKDMSNEMAKAGSVSNLISKLSKDINDNTRMDKEVQAIRNSMIALREEIERTRDSAGELNAVKYREFDAEVRRLHAAMLETGKVGDGLVTKVGKAIQSQTAQFIGRWFSLMDIIRYIQEISRVVIQLDSDLIELRKVSDATTARLQQTFRESAETATELGSSISDVIKATSDWARMGYDVDAAEELARVTTLYKNVGDGISQEEASASLISTLQGFQMAYTDAESIIDRFNEVSNNFAITSGGIGESLQRSAAAFNAANTDLSKSIALISGTNEIVQDVDSVGAMWTTVSARIRGASTELQDMGEETDAYVESTSKLRDLVKGITGVDIMLDENTYKDIYTIVTQIAEKWDSISDIDQAALLEALAGKRQANRLAATITNIDRVKEAYETAENAAGKQNYLNIQ